MAETTDFERRVYYLQFPRGRGVLCQAGPHGEAPKSFRKQE